MRHGPDLDLAFGFGLEVAVLLLEDAERLLATRDASAEARARKLGARRAVSLGLAACLLVYLVGGRMQAMDLVWRILGVWLTVLAILLLVNVIA